MSNYQTLSDFLLLPFGIKSNAQKLIKYEILYKVEDNKIILNAYTKIDESYYFHVKIPSETQKDGNVFYDVVIRFFTDKPSALSSHHLRDYYIQFFSNSPGFIYNYAVLYKNKGYLIEWMYEKMDPRYFDKLPTKTNPTMELSYDKTIYFACKFLSERKFKVLNKIGISLGKKLSPEKFFKEIKDFQSIRIENALLSLEKKSLKEIKKSLDTSKNNKTTASLSTSSDKQKSSITRKTPTKSTSLVKSIVRKTAGKSTRKT